jgi:hypothetical protein
VPADSCDADQRAWLLVQKEWRAERQDETDGVAETLTGTAMHRHQSRSTDPRFAELASKPYETLSADERTWLVSESLAQVKATKGPGLLRVSLYPLGAYAALLIVALIYVLHHPAAIDL